MASHRGAEGERTGADGRRREQDAEGWAAGHRGSRGRAGPPEQRAAGRSRLQGRRPPAEQRAGATRESRAQGRRRLLISREIFVATSQNPLSLPRSRAPVTPRARSRSCVFALWRARPVARARQQKKTAKTSRPTPNRTTNRD